MWSTCERALDFPGMLSQRLQINTWELSVGPVGEHSVRHLAAFCVKNQTKISVQRPLQMIQRRRVPMVQWQLVTVGGLDAVDGLAVRWWRRCAGSGGPLVTRQSRGNAPVQSTKSTSSVFADKSTGWQQVFGWQQVCSARSTRFCPQLAHAGSGLGRIEMSSSLFMFEEACHLVCPCVSAGPLRCDHTRTAL